MLNALVSSLFVYKMNVLCKIPVNIIEEINTEIRDKKIHIKLQSLTTQKKYRGLKLFNLEYRNQGIGR